MTTDLTIEPAATLVIPVNQNGGMYTDPIVPGTRDDFTFLVSGDRTGTFGSIYYDGLLLPATSVGIDLFRSYVGAGLRRN